MSVDNINKLKLKWAFSFPDSARARSQPVIAGGGLFTAGSDGTVYALNPENGCVHWTFKATSNIKTSITIDDWSYNDSKNFDDAPSIYFGDIGANAYAVNAITGELRWKTKIDNHKAARVSGSVIKYKNRLYVPVASAESMMSIDPNYSCCTFRGSVSALNAYTGKILWKTYVIPTAPTERGKNANGVPQFGPSGAGVWNSPTIDEKRERLYVGTGENASSPPVNGGSVIAIDMVDGNIAWVMQGAPGEAYNGSCSTLYSKDEVNCPKEYKGRIGLC